MTGAVILFAVLTLGPPQQEPVGPVATPAATVAGHVRSALSDPEEVMNWAVLEASVQEFESTDQGNSPSLWTSALQSASESSLQILVLLILFLTLLPVLRLVSKLRLRARRSASAASSRAAQDVSKGRAWTAAVLSEQGLSDLEIARRTGLARDAVSLALNAQALHASSHQRSVA